MLMFKGILLISFMIVSWTWASNNILTSLNHLCPSLYFIALARVNRSIPEAGVTLEPGVCGSEKSDPESGTRDVPDSSPIRSGKPGFFDQ